MRNPCGFDDYHIGAVHWAGMTARGGMLTLIFNSDPEIMRRAESRLASTFSASPGLLARGAS